MPHSLLSGYGQTLQSLCWERVWKQGCIVAVSTKLKGSEGHFPQSSAKASGVFEVAAASVTI